MTDEDLIEKIKNTKGPHAKCPCFIARKYEWMEAEVLDYLPDEKKFCIKLLYNDEIKKVNRLSLIFNIEDPIKY